MDMYILMMALCWKKNKSNIEWSNLEKISDMQQVN